MRRGRSVATCVQTLRSHVGVLPRASLEGSAHGTRAQSTHDTDTPQWQCTVQRIRRDLAFTRFTRETVTERQIRAATAAGGTRTPDPEAERARRSASGSGTADPLVPGRNRKLRVKTSALLLTTYDYEGPRMEPTP